MGVSNHNREQGPLHTIENNNQATLQYRTSNGQMEVYIDNNVIKYNQYENKWVIDLYKLHESDKLLKWIQDELMFRIINKETNNTALMYVDLYGTGWCIRYRTKLDKVGIKWNVQVNVERPTNMKYEYVIS